MMRKKVFLLIAMILAGCGKTRKLFKKERPVNELYSYVNAELLKAMRYKATEKEALLRKEDSLLGYIGISRKDVALDMNWVLDTFDVTGDKKPELLLYIPTDREHNRGIVAVYDRSLNVLFKDIGYLRAKFVEPRYSRTGFIYYIKIQHALATHNFVGPYLGECKIILSVEEAVRPLPLNFDAEIYSERHMRFDFYFGGQLHSEYVLQQDGEFYPLTDNLLYIVSQIPAYKKTFPFLDKLVSHSFLGIITPFVVLSPDSEKFVYAKEDSIKVLYVRELKSKGLFEKKGKVVYYSWRPNSAGILIKTKDGIMPHYYIIYFEGLPSVEIDMNAVFYKAATETGGPIKFTLHPEIDSWIKEVYWEDLSRIAFIIDYKVGYPGKIKARYKVKVYVDAASGMPLDVVPLTVQKAVVPLFKLTDVRWIDETKSIVEYRFAPSGVFYWRSLNSPRKGFGKYEVQGKRKIVLYYRYDIMEKPGENGQVVEDTFNIARIEVLRVVNAPDGSLFLVTEDGVRLYPETGNAIEE